MLRSYRNIGLALGLICLIWPVQFAISANGHTTENRSKAAKDNKLIQSPPVKDSLARIANDIEAAQAKQESADDKKRADEELKIQRHMDWWALGSLFLSCIGVILIWRTLVHTRRSAQAAVDTIKLARDEFHAGRYPKLKIVRISMDPPIQLPIRSEQIVVSVTYFIVNYGDDEAIITDMYEGIESVPDTVFSQLDNPRPLVTPVRIAAGSFMRVSFSAIEGDFITHVHTHSWAHPVAEHGAGVYFRAQFNYLDSRGIERHVSACRRYNFKAHVFRAIDNEDLEYAE